MMASYRMLGFEFNPPFSGDTAARIVINDTAYAKFDSFCTRPRPDSQATRGGHYALPLDSKEAVEANVATTLESGGGGYCPPVYTGFTSGRAFANSNGDIWELFLINLSTVP